MGQSAFDRAAAMLHSAHADRQQKLEYLQTLLDTVSAALIVVQDDGRVTLVNRAARALAGAAVDQLALVKSIGPRVARELLELRAGTRQILDLPDGHQIFVSVSRLSTQRYGQQRMLSLHSIAGQLDAVELKAWKDMAGVLAHEIMNSLTAISSLSESLEMLLRNRDGMDGDTELEGALEAIKRRSLGLMDFVERYRMVTDMPAPDMQHLRLEELLSGIERLLGPGLHEKSVVFSRSVEPPDLACSADPHLLEQAVINLLKNAVEAVGGVSNPKVEVGCYLREGFVVIAVTDNGCGLPDASGEEGFVPLFTTKSGGAGIGLNLVRQIALSHGGQLEARRNQPSGSIFELILPVDAS
jgi:nitrogen fixation/metabolism regulation signal transduction histidine kinase